MGWGNFMWHMLVAGLVCLLAVQSQAETVRTSSPCDFGATDNVNNGDVELAKKVESIFATSCKSCHGLGQVGGAAVMTDIMDRDLVVKEGMVSLTDPQGSKIIKAINRPTRWMPLGGAQLADADKQAILAWIQDGATDWKGSAPVNDPILTHLQEMECVAHDQSKLSTKDAYYVRYLTLGHLKGKDFETARAGVNKLVNHLTFANKPRALANVDKIGKILRLDMRYFEPNLDFAAWEKLVINGYPYAYVSEDDKIFNFYVEKINKYAYSERAVIRGDWFIAQTGQEPVYGKIMRLPKTIQEVEKYILKIDTDKEILGAYAERSSVAKSGVTNYPRLVDKFEFDFIGAGHAAGLYWKTYDFNGDKGTRNIYGFPFGPRILTHYFGWDEAKLFAAKVFENDAGETIAQLPNGFQFYTIYDAKGNLVAEANPHIAVDKSGLYDDLKVRSPMSCLYCHSGGPNLFDDDSVKRHVNAAPGFNVDEVKAVNDLYSTADKRHEAFGLHADTFKKSMEAIGLTGAGYLTPPGEPVSNSFRKFDGYMSCQDLAWELSLKLPQLVSYLTHSPELVRELGLADCETGKLSRKNYEHLFAKILREFDLGFQVKVGGGHVVIVDKCKYIFTNRSNRTVKFKVQYGSNVAEQVQINHGVTKAFEFDAKLDGRVSDLWEWSNGSWWTYKQNYTVAGCRNYAFLWNNGRGVGLFQD